jgi:hypothetical protein
MNLFWEWLRRDAHAAAAAAHRTVDETDRELARLRELLQQTDRLLRRSAQQRQDQAPPLASARKLRHGDEQTFGWSGR